MTLRAGSKVTVKVDDGFLGRTGKIAETDKTNTVHDKCDKMHYFVDLDAAGESPAEERVMFHAEDVG